MNRFVTGSVVLISCLLCTRNLSASSPEVEKARQHGAQGQVTLCITDSTGKPVEKAQLSVAFFPSDSSADFVISEGQTDTNGLYVATGKTIHSMNFTVTKEGYYTTEGQYWFLRQSDVGVQNNRWQPWNPTNKVVLKEHRNPLPMYAKNIDTSIPDHDRPTGFDLEFGDWVAPYGKGKQADLLITYNAKIEDVLIFSNQLIIACSARLGGLQRTRKEIESSFLSAYEAPNNGYQPQMALAINRTKNNIITREEFGDKEYLIFRIRTVLDEKGNIVSAQYGKIYGPIEYGRVDENHGGVRFTYYLNPTPNDRNLEFDPSRNLFGQNIKQRVYQP